VAFSQEKVTFKILSKGTLTLVSLQRRPSPDGKLSTTGTLAHPHLRK
jgi:hypothetical protein